MQYSPTVCTRKDCHITKGNTTKSDIAHRKPIDVKVSIPLGSSICRRVRQYGNSLDVYAGLPLRFYNPCATSHQGSVASIPDTRVLLQHHDSSLSVFLHECAAIRSNLLKRQPPAQPSTHKGVTEASVSVADVPPSHGLDVHPGVVVVVKSNSTRGNSSLR